MRSNQNKDRSEFIQDVSRLFLQSQNEKTGESESERFSVAGELERDPPGLMKGKRSVPRDKEKSMDAQGLMELAKAINGLATVSDRLLAVTDFCNRNPCYKRKDVEKKVKEMSAFVYVLSIEAFRRLVNYFY